MTSDNGLYTRNTEQAQGDPIALAYDKLASALAEGGDDTEAREILQAALPTTSGAPTLAGVTVADWLRDEGTAADGYAAIRALVDDPADRLSVVSEHAANPPPVSWLVPEWMPDATLSVLTGAGGAGKTRIALQLAVAVATGAEQFITTSAKRRPLGMPNAPALIATAGETVVYAAWETRRLAFANRLAAICGQGQDRQEKIDRLSGRLHYANMRPAGGLWGAEKGAHTSTAGAWLDGGIGLRKYAEQVGARLLVIDPLAAALQ